MDRRLKSATRRGLLALCIFALAATGAHARTLTIRSFKAEIVVTPEGDVDVTETINAYFAGSWNGLYRTIPIEYQTPQGLGYTLFVTTVSIADENGSALRYETSHVGGLLKYKIYVPNAQDAAKTIVLHYRVSDGLRFFEDHDELYWNITGNQWDVPIQSVSAEISLPSGVTGIRTSNFTGSYGSRSQDASVATVGNMITVKMDRPLDFYEGLTIVVGWDKGFVRPPTASEHVWRFLRSNWPLFIPIAAFFVMFWMWWTRGRDPRRNPIAVQYDPPNGLSPGEIGTLVDNSADMRDVTATLVDLAVRGYIVIEEKQKEHMMGLYSNKEFTFHLKKEAKDWVGLKQHELLLLAALFDDGARDSVDLSELQNKFYKNLPGIKDSLFDSLLERHYYLHRPDKVKGAYIGGGIVTGVLLFFAGNWIASTMGMVTTPFVIAAILTGLIVSIFGYFMPAHTVEGVRALEGALGFEDFLQHVEADRIQRIELTPALFEKYLPFAMAMGVEKKWVSAFGNILKEPPSWYQGGMYGPPFFAMGFVNGLNSMSVQAGSVMSSAPRSSGSSGFGGGGGFSGGGFGGGGGGGF
jgi:uncharacterized membrane protein